MAKLNSIQINSGDVIKLEKDYYVSAHFKWDATITASSEEEARNLAKVQFITEFGQPYLM